MGALSYSTKAIWVIVPFSHTKNDHLITALKGWNPSKGIPKPEKVALLSVRSLSYYTLLKWGCWKITFIISKSVAEIRCELESLWFMLFIFLSHSNFFTVG